jgi:hypothetical protein
VQQGGYDGQKQAAYGAQGNASANTSGEGAAGQASGYNYQGLAGFGQPAPGYMAAQRPYWGS